MVKTSFRSSILAASLLLGVGFSGSALASFTSCSGVSSTGVSYDISGKVIPSTGCTILNPLGGPGNDSVNGSFTTFTVNVEQFFGFNNWGFDGKFENLAGDFVDASSLFNFTGTGQSGSFSLAGTLDPAITSIMFVFKDGSDTNLVGYLIPTMGPFPGTYSSPFTEPPFAFNGASPRNVSHISVYYRNGGDSPNPPSLVPEPNSLLLAGLAIAVAGVASRRRQLI